VADTSTAAALPATGPRAAIQSRPHDLGSSDRRRAFVYPTDGFCWLNEHWHSWSPRWSEGMAQRWNVLQLAPVSLWIW